MNDIERAKEYLKGCQLYRCGAVGNISAIDTAISALEKQIPKQVTIKHSKANLRYLNCPTCDTTVKFSDNYCKICGQALKGV